LSLLAAAAIEALETVTSSSACRLRTGPANTYSAYHASCGGILFLVPAQHNSNSTTDLVNTFCNVV
jgi:hypothetical protein